MYVSCHVICLWRFNSWITLSYQWRIQDFPDGGCQPIISPNFPPELHKNKTVLLREHKRHTDHHLSSTPCAVLYWGGGVPQVDAPWLGYPPVLTWPGGLPRVGAPLAGVPPILTWPGGYPRRVPPWLGYPHPDLARGVPQAGASCPGYPPARLGWGYPRQVPSPARVPPS